MTQKEEIVTLIDEDGEQFDFVVLDYFRVDELDYAILFPLEKNLLEEQADDDSDEESITLDDADEGEAIIFRVVEGGNGETILNVIEDEEEWERVAGVAYERLLAGEDEDNEEE